MRGMLEFQARYGSEAGCLEALARLRWPQGYVCARSRRLQAAGKHANVVIAATAREMLGFAWAIAREVAPHKTQVNVPNH